jgi:hypothetical protein
MLFRTFSHTQIDENMKRLILLFTLLPLFTFAQQTYVPDDNFEQALIDQGFDNVLDDSVNTNNISGEISLYIIQKGILDLTGIEDFSSLTFLDCSHNELTSLDLSQNNLLKYLYCSSNELSTLDLTLNPALEILKCNSNAITALDLSQNSVLNQLMCYNNLLHCLNVNNGNNVNVLYFIADNNSFLNCIEVDNVAYSNANWTGIDPLVSFSTNCNYPANCFSTVTITENTNNINLYPNPTNNLITLDIEGYNGSVNVEVYDLQGRLLETTTNTTISMGEYAKGIYVFKVAYGDRTQELKVVKE